MLAALIGAGLAFGLSGVTVIQGADSTFWSLLGWGLFVFGLVLLGVAAYVWRRRGPKPKLSIGALDVPLGTQPIAEKPGYQGRVVRLKVSNGEGRADAKNLHATLTFRRRDGSVVHSDVPGQWEGHPHAAAIDLPGTGQMVGLDLFLVLDAAGGSCYVWNRHSIAAKLGTEYHIDEGEFWIELLLRAQHSVHAQERIWVVGTPIPRVGKESDGPPLWDQLSNLGRERSDCELVEQEIAEIIAQGERVAGDFLTEPAWDEYTYWKDSSAEFLGTVFGPAARDRLERESSAEDKTTLVENCIGAVRAILDGLDCSQLRVSGDELQTAIEQRRAAPTGFTDWLRNELED